MKGWNDSSTLVLRWLTGQLLSHVERSV